MCMVKVWNVRNQIDSRMFCLLLAVNAEDKAKILQDLQPRFLEDEGFYVGTRPKISGWNVNKMENRLIKELHVGID